MYDDDLDDLLGAEDSVENQYMEQAARSAFSYIAYQTRLAKKLKKKGMKLLLIAISALLGAIIVVIILSMLFGGLMSIRDKLLGWTLGGDGTDEDYFDYTQDLTVEEGQAPLDDDPNYTGVILKAMQEGNISFSNEELENVDDSDFMRLLENCILHNEKKYEETDVYYTYWQEIYNETSQVWQKNMTDPFDNVLDYTTIRRMDIEGEKDDDGRYRFDMEWQTLFVIMNLLIQSQAEDWGSTGDAWDDTFIRDGFPDYDGYFIADEQIDGICSLMGYNFTYYYDGVADTSHGQDHPYLFEEFEGGLGIGFRYDASENYDTEIKEYHIRYIPDSAPDKIANCYESYTYLYEDDPVTGGKKCIGRQHYRDAEEFVAMMLVLAPDFEAPLHAEDPIEWYDVGDEVFDTIIEMLEILPYTESQIAYMRQLKYEYDNNIVIDELEPIESETFGYASEVKSIDVILGSATDFTETGSTEIEQDTAFQIWISEYTATGSVSGVTKHLVVNDWYNVSEQANHNLMTSDGLSKAEIQKMLQYLEKLAQKNKGYSIPFSKCTDALYAWQQEKNASVSGILAIILTEGGYGYFANDYYNFFNMKPYGSEKYFVYHSKNGAVSKWTDFKAIYGSIDTAIVGQFNKIYNNYFLNQGQNSYYLMCFKGYDGSSPETADSSKITHSYCPWFDDTGYLTTGYDSAFGWCNKCGSNRKLLLQLVGAG